MTLTREDRLRLIEHLKESLELAWVPKVGDRVTTPSGVECEVIYLDGIRCIVGYPEGYSEAWDVSRLSPIPMPTTESPLAYLDRTKYRVQWFHDGWAVDGPTRMGVITRGHRTSREAIEAAMAKEDKR